MGSEKRIGHVWPTPLQQAGVGEDPACPLSGGALPSVSDIPFPSFHQAPFDFYLQLLSQLDADLVVG